MDENGASAVVWRRLGYMLTPQLDIYRHLADRLEGKRVLEVGFGTGVGVLQYISRANGVVAMDPDSAAVKFARGTLPVAGVHWIAGDITQYEDDEQYDAVVMVEVLEHIPLWFTALERIRDLLAPGGEFYLSHRNSNADLRKNDLHEREWTAGELLSNLSKFFRGVRLYDYTLTEEQGTDSRLTPLVAVSRK